MRRAKTRRMRDDARVRRMLRRLHLEEVTPNCVQPGVQRSVLRTAPGAPRTVQLGPEEEGVVTILTLVVFLSYCWMMHVVDGRVR